MVTQRCTRVGVGVGVGVGGGMGCRMHSPAPVKFVRQLFPRYLHVGLHGFASAHALLPIHVFA